MRSVFTSPGQSSKPIQPVRFVIRDGYTIVPVEKMKRVPFPEPHIETVSDDKLIGAYTPPPLIMSDDSSLDDESGDDDATSADIEYVDPDIRECVSLSHYTLPAMQRYSAATQTPTPSNATDLNKTIDGCYTACISSLYLTLKIKEIQLMVVNLTKTKFRELKAGSSLVSGLGLLNSERAANDFITTNAKLIRTLEAEATKYHRYASAYFLEKLSIIGKINIKSANKASGSSDGNTRPRTDWELLYEYIVEDAEALLKTRFQDISNDDILKFEDDLRALADKVAAGLTGVTKIEMAENALAINVLAHAESFTTIPYIYMSVQPYRLLGFTFQEFLEYSLYKMTTTAGINAANSVAGTQSQYSEILYKDEKIYDLAAMLEYYISKIKQLSNICDNCNSMVPPHFLTMCKYCGVGVYCSMPKRNADGTNGGFCADEDNTYHENICFVTRKIWGMAIDEDIKQKTNKQCIIS